jgi:hypothetical protein
MELPCARKRVGEGAVPFTCAWGRECPMLVQQSTASRQAGLDFVSVRNYVTGLMGG